jgi:hypothetical protein
MGGWWQYLDPRSAARSALSVGLGRGNLRPRLSLAGLSPSPPHADAARALRPRGARNRVHPLSRLLEEPGTQPGAGRLGSPPPSAERSRPHQVLVRAHAARAASASGLQSGKVQRSGSNPRAREVDDRSGAELTRQLVASGGCAWSMGDGRADVPRSWRRPGSGTRNAARCERLRPSVPSRNPPRST